MIKGCIPALVTPFKSDSSLCIDSFSRLVRWHRLANTGAILVLGSTGESTSLTDAERDKIISVAIHESGGMQVWVGATSSSTAQAMAYAVRAKELGADGVLVAAPPYVKATECGLIKHYEQLSTIGIDILVYNHPGRTGTDITPGVVRQLRDLPNIVGIKETADMARIKEYVRDDFVAYCGDDPVLDVALEQGAIGSISVVGNLTPQLVQEFVQTRSAAAWNKLQTLQDTLGCQSNPIPVKWALHKLGMIPSNLRLPLVELEPQFHSLVETALHEVVDEKDFIADTVSS